MDKEFIRKAYELYLGWEKGYRKEAKECDYQALDWVYCPEEAREDEKKYRRDVRAALQGQIEFIKHHVSLMAIEPSERGTLSYIGRFLSMQHLVAKYFMDGERPPITITFWGGSPVCARVHVEELSDIDFEDSYSYLYFSTICISNRDYKTWSRKRIEEVIQHIKEDMEFDGDEVEIELEFDWQIDRPGSHEISLHCEVKEF
ncbi:MAG: hypothetical protein ACLQGU_17465 [bacterium]